MRDFDLAPIPNAIEILRRLRILMLIVVAYITIGTVFYHHVEKFRWLDSVYFCTVSLLTVGYGDYTPKTDWGKLFTIFYLIFGVGILAAFATNLLRGVLARRQIKEEKREGKLP